MNSLYLYRVQAFLVAYSSDFHGKGSYFIKWVCYNFDGDEIYTEKHPRVYGKKINTIINLFLNGSIIVNANDYDN